MRELVEAADYNGMGVTAFSRMVLLWATRYETGAHIRFDMRHGGPHVLSFDVDLDVAEMRTILEHAVRHGIYKRYRLGGYLAGCWRAFKLIHPDLAGIIFNPTNPTPCDTSSAVTPSR